ncbi:hypothetical protein [Natrinema pallidum]|nr:hypothetical protein [Natrinema pallidum]
MSDFCVQCGDAESTTDAGEYVEVSDEALGIYTDVWVCDGCLPEDSDR